MLFILFYTLRNTTQITLEMNLPLNLIPTQCSETSGAYRKICRIDSFPGKLDRNLPHSSLAKVHLLIDCNM